MIRMVIDGAFRMRGDGKDEWLPATVPGSVYADLLRNGRIDDPYWRDNELHALELMDKDYEYVGIFDMEGEMLKQKKVYLHFDGLDTLADIYLNKRWIGYVNNMHRIWEFEVSEILKCGENELRILFHSPTKFIEEEYRKEAIGGSEDAMCGFSKLRKAHCMFGWDWGPRLPDAGIWREISLIGVTMHIWIVFM